MSDHSIGLGAPADRYRSNWHPTYLNRLRQTITRRFFVLTRAVFRCLHRHVTEVTADSRTPLFGRKIRATCDVFAARLAGQAERIESHARALHGVEDALARCKRHFADQRNSEVVVAQAFPEQPRRMVDGQPPASSPLTPLLAAEEREAALIKLIFAAKRLAESHISEFNNSGCRICRDCQLLIDSAPHARTCDVGVILNAIETLERLTLEHPPTRKEETREEEARPGAEGSAPEAPDPPGDYGEPWHAENPGSGARRIFDREETLTARTMSSSPQENSDWAERIVACVNFCRGIETSRLAVSVPLDEMGIRVAEGVAGLFAEKAGRL